MPYWMKEEEQLFEKAWKSGEYDPDTMSRVFQRSFDALRAKAKNMGLPTWEAVEGEVRLRAIREALDNEVTI